MPDLLSRLSAEAQQYETAGPPHIRDLLLEAEVEIERLRNESQSLRECLRVVREYVSSELADDPSQDDPSCELYPLIELVRKMP